ncbi:MAG TPA: hypothetical protein QGF58_27445 [Myxococcota bacterium]|nr:hypothetical protein [Myxococcota bacterium]
MSELARLVDAYDASFRAEMPVGIDEIDDPSSVLRRAEALGGDDRDLLDTLLLAGDAGDPIDPRFAGRIETHEMLWLGGFVLPRARPSSGATIDPRFYAAASRLSPHLRGRHPFAGALPAAPGAPSFPPGDARFDRVVAAAALEARPPSLTRDGSPRKDQIDRLLGSLGDPARWRLALRLARACGMARPAAGRLYGFPESRPRRLVDPAVVLDSDEHAAGRLLLRLVGEHWARIDDVLALLGDRAAGALPGNPDAALRLAAEVFHRIGVLEGSRDAEGLVSVRKPGEQPRLPTGFLLTPDMDIIVGAGELSSSDYGRLCRLAPYVDGDRVHRHKLTRGGVAADMAVGNLDVLDFLAEHSRTGVPLTVQQSIVEWARSAERITLFSGVTVVEDEEGRLRRGPGAGRVIDYTEPPPAAFHMEGDRIVVPVGRDALTVRAALARVGSLAGRDRRHWYFDVAPRPVDDVNGLLETLRRLHVDSTLPGELEVRVRAASGVEPARTEAALVIHLPASVTDAIRRDHIAGPLLAREVVRGQCLVREGDMEALRERLEELGITIAR